MAKFHRFVDPIYFGAPSLAAPPAAASYNGAQYDRLNVISGGTGGSGAAFADGPKGSGPNVGSYLVAFAEDATSSNANRGLRALAENTDFLDDLMNRDLAVPVRTNTVTAGVPVTSIVLPASTFVGHTGGYPIDMLFSVVDQNDREIITATGDEVKVASISGASVGDGFSTSAITLTLSHAIAAGVQYRVYYASRSNLATLPVDALAFIRIRGAEEVDADVENVFRQIQGPTSVGLPWNATPLTTLYDLGFMGLNEVLRRGTSRDMSFPAYHPVSISTDVAGSGSWYERDQTMPGVAGYAAANLVDVYGTLGHAENYMGGVWSVVNNDTLSITGISAPGKRVGFTSGFVYLGNRRSGLSDNTAGNPGIFSFYHGVRRLQGAGDSNDKTNLKVGDVVTINSSGIVTLPATSWFYKFISGVDRSAIAEGYDIIRVLVGSTTHNLVVRNVTGAQTAELVYPDGATWSGGDVNGTIVEWIQSAMFMADGAAQFKAGGGTPKNNFHGFTFVDAPVTRHGATAVVSNKARFFGRSSSSTVLTWGAYDDASFGFVETGALQGDGSLDTNNIYASGSLTVTNGTTLNGAVVLGATLFVTSSALFDSTLAVNDDLTVFADIFGSAGYFDNNVTADNLRCSRVREKVLTRTGTTATFNLTDSTVGGSGAQMAWYMDGSNASGTDTAQVTINGIGPSLGSTEVPAVLRLIVRRTSTSRMKKISFSTPGYTSRIDGPDADLLPVSAGSQYYWDIYEGHVIPSPTADIVWTVKRTITDVLLRDGEVMRSIFYNRPVGVGATVGDNMLLMPEVRGWPLHTDGGYDASSPGTTFDRWNANAGIFVSGGGVFTVSRSFNLAGAANSLGVKTTFWIPKPGVNYIVLAAFFKIDSILLHTNDALSPVPSQPVRVGISVGTPSISMALINGQYLLDKYIADTDANWVASGPVDSAWTPGSSSFTSEGPFGSAAGDSSPTANFADTYNMALHRGYPSMFSLPVSAVGNPSDRFIIFALGNEPDATLEITGSAGMVVAQF